MQNIKKFLGYMFATFFGVGFSPIIPGTFGSVASFIAIVPTAYYYGFYGLLIFAISSFVIGWLSTRIVLKYTEHDPGLIVIDETVGQTITFSLIANMLKGSFSNWYLYILGFVLFRIFDMTKPLFIGWADRKILNAFGVIFDDILAGLVSGICLYLISFI